MREIRHQSRADEVPIKKQIAHSSNQSTVPTQSLKFIETEDKPRTEVRTKLGQTEDKVRTNLGQKFETEDKVRAQPRTEVRTKLGQTEDKVRTKIDFLSLSTLQRTIIFFIYENARANGAKTTDAIAISAIASFVRSTVLSVRKTIQRLELSRILIREYYKGGRGGWTKYRLPDALYNELLRLETEDKLRTKLGQTEDKVRAQLETQLRTSAPSSSSDLKNKTTTTETEDKLSEDWLEIDFSSLKSFGFSENHLTQLARQNLLTPEAVQNSIYAFTFDLENNKKGKVLNSSPVNFFMGILRKGLPYTPPSNYESPEDKARREHREALEIRAKKRMEDDRRMQVLEFEEWRRGVTIDWIRRNLSDLAWSPGPAQEGSLKNYFEKNIWPSLQNQFQDSQGTIS